MSSMNTIRASIFLLSVATVLVSVWSCPGGCVCNSIASGTRALCSSPTTKTIPRSLSPTTDVLTIQGTQATRLPLTRLVRSDFGHLTELVHLKISFTNLTYVAEDAFFSLTKLKRLELDNNRLSSLLPNTFSGLGSTLAFASLSNNRGLHLHHRTFWNLPALREIYLSGLGLHEIDPLTFYGLNGLRTLDLSANELTYLSPGVMSSMPDLWSLDLAFNNLGSLDPLLERFFLRLRRLQLGGNRWQCNCLLKWLKKYPAIISPSRGSDPVICAGPPSLEYSHLLDLDNSLLTCSPPNIVSCPDSVSAQIGESLTIKCLVTGDPYPRITWTFADGSHLASGSYPGMPLQDRAAIFIRDVAMSHNGTVTLTAHNTFGTKTSQIKLRVDAITTTPVPSDSTSLSGISQTVDFTSSRPQTWLSSTGSAHASLPSKIRAQPTQATQKVSAPVGSPTKPTLKILPNQHEDEADGASQASDRYPQPENNIPAIAAASAAGGAAVILAAVVAVRLCSRVPFVTAAHSGKVAPVATGSELENSPQSQGYPRRLMTFENSHV